MPLSPADKLRRGRLASFWLLVALMAFLAAEILLAPARRPEASAVLAVLVLLPLAAFLRPLWRGNPGSAIWLSMLLMPYFCWAGLGAFAPGPDGVLAILRGLLIGACFTALMLLVRWHKAASTAA